MSVIDSCDVLIMWSSEPRGSASDIPFGSVVKLQATAGGLPDGMENHFSFSQRHNMVLIANCI